MKTIRAIYILAVLTATTAVISAQNYPDEYLGLPGDNLNLYAVMDLFQESETLEAFERGLNDPEKIINNLDLNGDNLVDYITVSDFLDGNAHTIVLRAALNRNEQQDVAVFVVEKLRNGAVQIQLIGDEALYGPNYIVEPIYAETPNPGYTGTVHRRNVNVVTTTYYDIAAWPLISYIYHPRYVVWRSSWYWGYYPSYWRPWRAHYWHYYYGYHYHWHDHYYRHYRHWDYYRCRPYYTAYRNRVRVYSPTVVVNINKGRYRTTYSRPERRHAGEQHYARTVSRRTGARAATTARTNSTRARVTTTRTTSPRAATVRTNQRSTPSVQRSSSSRSRPSTVQSRQPSRAGSSTVQRSQPSPSRSSATVSRSSSSQSRGSATVSRSSSSQSRGSATVSRSSSRKTTPSVQRSSSSRKSSGSASSSSSRSSSSRSSSKSSRR